MLDMSRVHVGLPAVTDPKFVFEGADDGELKNPIIICYLEIKRKEIWGFWVG